MIRVKSFLFLFSFFLANLVSGQIVPDNAINYSSENIWLIEERASDFDFLFSQKDVSYLGLDFSKCVFVSSDSLKSEILSESDYRYFYDKFQKQVIGEDCSKLNRSLKHRIVSCPDTAKSLINSTSYVTDSTYYRLSGDSLQLYLEGLNTADCLDVSFVILVESINRDLEQVVVNYVFFESATKAVIWYAKMRAPLFSIESNKNWYEALSRTFFRYRRLYFEHKP